MNMSYRVASVMLLLPLCTLPADETAPTLPDQYAEVVLHVEGMI